MLFLKAWHSWSTHGNRTMKYSFPVTSFFFRQHSVGRIRHGARQHRKYDSLLILKAISPLGWPLIILRSHLITLYCLSSLYDYTLFVPREWNWISCLGSAIWLSHLFYFSRKRHHWRTLKWNTNMGAKNILCLRLKPKWSCIWIRKQMRTQATSQWVEKKTSVRSVSASGTGS